MEKPGRNDFCWCGSGKKYKKCHIDFDEKIEEASCQGHIVPSHDIIKNEEQINKIKDSAKINIAVLDYVAAHIKEGISTAEIDKWVYDITVSMGGIPAPLNYEGFPKSVCTSINNEVCHGIPSESVILKSGDIINVDVSTNLNGYYSDSSRMFCIGNVSTENRRLVEEAKNPWVSYVSLKNTEMLMVPGMIFTIEPMINMGKPDIFVDEDDGWTIYTEDNSPSAQWEIQVLVTETGYEIISY